MPLATDRFLFGKILANFNGLILSSDIDNVQFRKDSVFQSRSNKYFTFFKGYWFFFHNGNFTSEVVRLLVFIFIKKLDKISSLGRKTFVSQFHCSYISFKLCTCVCQTLRRTNNSSNLSMESSSLLWGIRRVRRKMKFRYPGGQIIVAHLGIETSCKGGRHFPAN